MTDLYFKNDGLFITLYPNNEAGEYIFKTICEKLGFKIPVNMWSSVKCQIKEAGYTVRRMTPAQIKKESKKTNAEILKILSESDNLED